MKTTIQKQQVKEWFPYLRNDSEDYRWYRRVHRELNRGKLSFDSAVMIQERGGPPITELIDLPELPPSPCMMDLIVVMQSDTHSEMDVYGAVINLIKNDYPKIAQGIPACRQETQNL